MFLLIDPLTLKLTEEILENSKSPNCQLVLSINIKINI